MEVPQLPELTPRPHQVAGIEGIKDAIAAGHKRICLTSPTGGGKSLMIRELIRWMLNQGGKSILYTHRRLLAKQLYDQKIRYGIPCGMLASGYERDLSAPVQVAMIHSENVRVFSRGSGTLFPGDLVFFDEAHGFTGPVVQRLMDEHIEAGGVIVGVTATPLDIGHLYQHLVCAGTNSELRACGAHVKCRTFAPDEPDTRGLKPQKTGEFTEGEVVKRIMTPTIFGRVYEHWKRLNKDGKPTILFGPGVAESLGFAEFFHTRGVRSAHIDGERVWLDGEEHPKTQGLVDYVQKESELGRLPLLCNRFVLREGIDMPHLAHCIMATIFGSLTSYLQAGGRLLRSHPSLKEVTLQDHGGNYWRHGSLNEDRVWKLGDTNAIKAAERAERIREGQEDDPIVCPNCGAVRLKGPDCPTCGFHATKRSRNVIQVDGSLREVRESPFKAREVKQTSDTEKKWQSCYFRARNAGHTFRQAEALFFRENGHYPPRTLPRMPKEAADWFRPVKDVPSSRLLSPSQSKPETALFS
jgi:hypothetical protein